MKKERVLGVFGLMVFFVVLFGCKKDDTPDAPIIIPIKDKKEVYEKDLATIETYLKTHTFNYEDFNFTDPYDAANDNFKIVFDTLDIAKTPDKKPLKDFVTSKVVKDSEIDYMLYMLKLREGKGQSVHILDNAILNYKGILLDGKEFDERMTEPVKQDLTYGIGVKGYREAVVEFKTATEYIENKDGSIAYKNYGMAAVFIPSGLAYFAASSNEIPAYSPLIFTINIIGRSYTDYDLDGIPSYIENPIVEDEYVDIDGDDRADHLDPDDDNDGIATLAEIDKETITGATKEEVKTKGEDLPKNKFLIAIIKVKDDLYEGKVIVFNDENKNGIYDHLDKNYPEEQ